MKSAKKKRIRVTLNVDSEIYGLVQKLSEIKGKPISRLFDEAFEPIVEQYRYKPEEWEVIMAERKVEQHEKLNQ